MKIKKLISRNQSKRLVRFSCAAHEKIALTIPV